MPARSLALSPFAALRHRNFRLFYWGQTTSLIGTWMQGLAQGWLVLDLTNSPFWVGLVSALGAVPILLFSLPGGVYADRADKRRVITRCQALFLAEAVLLTVLVATRQVQPWHVAALATFHGAVSAVEIPARQAFIVELVGKEDLTNAIALNSSAFNATRILGPAVAGWLVASVGIAWCFAANAVSYAAVLAGLRALRLPRWRAAETAGGGWQQVREGLRFVGHDRRVFALVLNTAVLSLFGFPFVVLLPVFARDELRVGAEGLGVMMAAVGVGALVSALGLAAFSGRVRRGRLVAWSSPVFGLAVAVFAVASSYRMALVVLLVAGFAMVLNNAATNTLLQSLTPDALRGRVMALWALVFVGFAPVGSLGIGALAARTGAPMGMMAGGLVSTLTTAWLWTRGVPELARQR